MPFRRGRGSAWVCVTLHLAVLLPLSLVLESSRIGQAAPPPRGLRGSRALRGLALSLRGGGPRRRPQVQRQEPPSDDEMEGGSEGGQEGGVWGRGAEGAEGEEGDAIQEVDASKILPQLKGMGMKVKVNTKGGEAESDRLAGYVMKQVDTVVRNMPREEVKRRVRALYESGFVAKVMGEHAEADEVEFHKECLDRSLDKDPELIAEEQRQKRLVARRRFFGYEWNDEDEKGLQRRLKSALAVTNGGRDPLPVPSNVAPSLQAGVEIALETGQIVEVQAGADLSWEPEMMTVLQNSSLRVQCQTARGAAATPRLSGAWDIMEGCTGAFRGGNYTFEGHEDIDTTVTVQGSAWLFEDCDIRCCAGVALCAINGRSSTLNFDHRNTPIHMPDPDNLDLSARVVLERCGIGGIDDGRETRATHFVTESEGIDEEEGERERKAVCAIDVMDTSLVECSYTSLLDTQSFVARTFEKAGLVLNRCHAAFSLSGIYAMHFSNVSVTDSAIEYIMLGAAVRIDDNARGHIKRCDIRECTYGVAMYEAAQVVVEASAMLNCSHGAYVAGVNNECVVTLKNNQVHTDLDSDIWWTLERPKVLKEEGRNEHFDHSKAFGDVLETLGYGREGELLSKEQTRKMEEEFKLPDLEECHRQFQEKLKEWEGLPQEMDAALHKLDDAEEYDGQEPADDLDAIL